MNGQFSPTRPIAPQSVQAPENAMPGVIMRFGTRGELPLITQYARIALRWKWAILASIGAALAIGLIATLLTTPLYTATTMLEIARDSDKVVKVEGVERENSVADMEFYQTQYGLLKSRALAERVATNMGYVDDPAFFDRFRAKPRGTVVAAGVKRFGAAGRDQRLRQAGQLLLDHLVIDPQRSSRLVSLSFTSSDPAFSAQVANTWGRLFIESNLERRFDATAYARRFLESRLEQLRQKLEQSERLLVAYAANQQILTLAPTASGDNGAPVQGAERSIVADNLAALNGELSQAIADRIKAQSRAGRNASNGASPEALGSAGLASLRQKRAEVAADYAKLLVQFEPDYPPARAMASQLAALDRSINVEEGRIGASFTATYRQSLARESALQARVDALKLGLLDLKRRSIQYNIFQRDVDTNRQLYDGLLQRYKEIGIAGGVGTNNVAIVDPAETPEKPSSPRMFLNLMLALLAGSVVGVGLSFALEQIDEAIADPGDVERSLGLPLLGAVPDQGDVDPLMALADRKSSLVEAYLAVQTNLEFATSHGAPRTFSVTSTRPAEGKSTTAFALAHSLARAQRSVVLIDADMRSPSVHHLFGVTNERGLSNFLSGSDDLAALLGPTAQPGLSFMTAGPPPPNAADLLSGPRLPLLLAKLLEKFDHVVVDSPPVMGLADAPLIASKVEGTVYAVQSHAIRASIVRVAIERLASAHANILGVVLTKFQPDRAHFGYGYDYGYGYGRQDTKASE